MLPCENHLRKTHLGVSEPNSIFNMNKKKKKTHCVYAISEYEK